MEKTNEMKDFCSIVKVAITSILWKYNNIIICHIYIYIYVERERFKGKKTRASLTLGNTAPSDDLLIV